MSANIRWDYFGFVAGPLVNNDPPERYQLNGHRQPVNRVIFYPVFNVIASCSDDSTIKGIAGMDKENMLNVDALLEKNRELEEKLNEAKKRIEALENENKAKSSRTVRLQQKVMLLEDKVKQYDREVMTGAPTRDRRHPDEWIPRPPERYQLNGHRQPVNRVIFHPVFNVIASCSDDSTIKIWDFESGEFERSLKGHTDSVQDIGFSSSGKLLVSCSADMSIKIWDFVGSYECLRTLRGHDHNISSVTFLPSGDFVLSASRDKLVKLWDVENGYCVQNFSGHAEWVRMVRVNATGTHFATCSNDKTLKVWCLTTKTLKATLIGHEHVVECVVWAPDATTRNIIAASSVRDSFIPAAIEANAKMNGGEQSAAATTQPEQMVIISASRDKKIRLWEAHSATCLFVLAGHDNWVRGVRLHPGGKYLVSVGDDKTMRVWSIENKRCTKALQAHAHFVTSIDFHPKLPFVVTSSVDTSVKVWECR